MREGVADAYGFSLDTPIRELSDGWTIVTKDHSLSAQWEHTVAVSEGGYEVLTLSRGTPPPAL